MPNPPTHARGTCYDCNGFGGDHPSIAGATICKRPQESGKAVSRMPSTGCMMWRVKQAPPRPRSDAGEQLIRGMFKAP